LDTIAPEIPSGSLPPVMYQAVAQVYASCLGSYLISKESEGKGFALSRTNRDDGIQQLVGDFWNGYLTRRGFLAKAAALGLTAAAATGLLGTSKIGTRRAVAQGSSPEVTPKEWEQGRGWGWVWGDDDQLGNLNELSPELTMKALSLVEQGKVYDLGLTYSRESFKWPGHNPAEIISFRTPAGELTQEDLDIVADEENNSTNTTFSSNALFISDNVATQLDTLGHINEGDPPHTYNDYRSEDIQGDWGLLKLGAETIPPIVAPATMIDVARSIGEDPLPESFAIGQEELEQALDDQGVDIDPLDVVLIRTGTGGVWLKGNGVGSNHSELASPDTAGLTVSGARWLVEEKGALAIGSDTASLEVGPPPDLPEQLDDGTSFNPVHVYLLVRQGVHILEYHNQEDLASDETYKFAYILGVNPIQGATAGTVLRPIGIA
jgi:kynurenine formamidase